MNLPEKKDKQIIMAHIVRFMDQFKPGEIVYSYNIYRYIKSYMNGKRLDDTPGRYLRLLRQQGKVNYKCVCRRTGKFEII